MTSATPLIDREADNRLLVAVLDDMTAARLPTATYRVQLQARCPFRDVAAMVPYLDALGVSDLYVSPFLQARPGSVHGYDIVNHATINPEIGTRDDLQELHAALTEHGMGLIADVVPNHMAAVPQLNGWWQDVLENGPSSAYAGFFDIDWQPLKTDLLNKVLLPVLGEQYGQVLEAGQLIVQYDEGAFWLTYGDQRFPIAPGSYVQILSPQLDELQQRLGGEHPDVLELLSIVTACKNLPLRTETDSDRLAERRREKEIVKRRLKDLTHGVPEMAGYVSQQLDLLNGRPGDPGSFDRLDDLLQRQPYRLASWRVASDEINYRRFFDINELAAICTETPQVFAETHRLLFELLDAGVITGLRIDHPDGLYDPHQYLAQLQEAHFRRLCLTAAVRLGQEATPAVSRLVEPWRTTSAIPGSPVARPLFLVIEKILAPGEALPDQWPVHGTVGYEFLNAVNGVFVDPHGRQPLTTLYQRLTEQALEFAELAYQCKRLIVRTSMASEVQVLGDRLDRISERNRRTRDYTRRSLTRTLEEIMSCFSVYRTYVQGLPILERDAAFIDRAVARAKRRNPAISADIFDFVRDLLLLRNRDCRSDEEDEAIRRFTGKFQQLTGPIMAKAVEDTACYRFNRLVSLNEVGGEPAAFGHSVAELHGLLAGRLPRHSHALSATSTHDTKRSEDVRARINVLSEIPREWRQRVNAWTRRLRRWKTDVDGRPAPSRNSEYLLYQTLIGIWPDRPPTGPDREALLARLQQYLLKVEREAKVETSWISPHESYEAAWSRLLTELFAPQHAKLCLDELHDFASQVAEHGRWNSLSQLLLKIAAPGVPDFYQGTELWNLTLVDPDNRHPVDFAHYRELFDALLQDLAADVSMPPDSDAVDAWLSPRAAAPTATPRRLLETRLDGRIKMFVTLLGLRCRRDDPELFTTGDYVPLLVTGRFADSVIAFARRQPGRCAIVIAPRLTVRVVGFGGPAPLSEVWQDTTVHLPDDLGATTLHDAFTRRTHELAGSNPAFPVADALREFPVGLWRTPGGLSPS